MIDGVVGVIIWTDRLDEMTEFYRDTMSFPVHSVRPYFVAFQLGEVRFSIGTHEHVSGRTVEPERVMINLGTEDIQNAYKTLSAKGVEFVRPPEQEHWGGWVATLLDPDGNTLQLLQQPEKAS
ncbi:MAG: VOC family protein [Chloroflexi bacterium]|nr:VOC family protein [Chloroflexota bacterium]MDA1226909.1 VOC family protein [Chloroflexota bacterium]